MDQATTPVDLIEDISNRDELKKYNDRREKINRDLDRLFPPKPINLPGFPDLPSPNSGPENPTTPDSPENDPNKCG